MMNNHKTFKLTVCSLLLSIGCTSAWAQDNMRLNLDHIAIGFEIGQNQLGIDAMNQGIASLGFEPIAYINNFAFQVLLGTQKRVEPYASLTLMYSYQDNPPLRAAGLLVSSYLGGTYVGFGGRGKVLSVFNERLLLVAAVELNKVFYHLECLDTDNRGVSADQFVNNARILLVRSQNLVVQPHAELLFGLLKRKNRFDLGIKFGYLYHIFQNEWAHRDAIPIQGLSPIINQANYNFSIKMLYSFGLD